MYDFDYYKPGTLEDAVATLARSDEFKLLAGGMSLIPALKLRLARHAGVIDLGALEQLRGIRREGDEIVIGAMTPHAEVAASPQVARVVPALAELAGSIGDPLVRNRGTLGGSIANADPAADYPAAVLGLGATVVTHRRTIAADDFFLGLFETALEPGEIITAVRFPIPQAAGYVKFRQAASRFALVGVYVADFGGNVRVGVTGAGASAFRQGEMEKALSSKFAPESVASIKVKPDGLNNDLHASPEYRAHLITVMAKRAVEAALK